MLMTRVFSLLPQPVTAEVMDIIIQRVIMLS